MYRASVLSFTLLATVFGQVESDLAPRPVDGEGPGDLPFQSRVAPAADAGKDHSRVLVRKLREVRLVAVTDAGAQPAVTAPQEGVTMAGLQVPDRDGLARRCAAFLGGPLTERGLDRLTDEVLLHYQDQGRPVVDIVVPDQDLSGGVLTVEIAEGRVGKVILEHSEHFDTNLLAKGVHVSPGDELTTPALQEQLDWLSRNPFRSANLFASPGLDPGTADLIFALEEQRPWRIYLGYENSGTRAAGENRYYFGGNWGDAFGLDHQLGYQFTVGDSLDQFQAHSVAYEVPLHQQHYFLRFNATWAQVEAAAAVGGLPLVSDGETWELYAALGRPLVRTGGFRQEVAFGVELKSTDNFLNFGGTTLTGDTVDIVQARLDYRASQSWANDRLAFSGALVGSPGGLTGNNDDSAFQAFRAGAQADYVYATARVDWQHRLPGDWSVWVSAEGQVASGELLAIEQLAIGGHDTVRGYDERIYLADSGYVFSTELRTPPITISEKGAGHPVVQFLGYLDHATGWRNFGNDESFTGVGLGTRTRIGDEGEFRFDVGWPLRKGDGAGIHAGFQMDF